MQAGCYARAALLSAGASLLLGCSSSVNSEAAADEAAVRQTLKNLEMRINLGDKGFVDVFANDAVIIAPGTPDVVGFPAIRTMYLGLMEGNTMKVRFSTEEVVVSGDLAYEHGTDTLKLTDKATGQMIQDVKNKHLHILKRQLDGSWKTWRMMVNRADSASGG